MRSLRKSGREVTAPILALFIIIYSAFIYVIPANQGTNADFNSGEGIFFHSASEPLAGYFLQQRTSEPLFHSWKVEVRFHAESIVKRDFCESPLRKVIRKILVINSISFTPCKSLLFFPFHEFS